MCVLREELTSAVADVTAKIGMDDADPVATRKEQTRIAPGMAARMIVDLVVTAVVGPDRRCGAG